MKYIRQWQLGAPVQHHCVGIYHDDYDPCKDDAPIACWTLLNPADGGDPLYYCDKCYSRMHEF